jgi:hypothetical protein
MSAGPLTLVQVHPARVADLRRELLEWLDSTDAIAFYDALRDDAGTWNKDEQRAALAAAELFFVSDEMTAVAVHAAQLMPDQVPLRAEFPADVGFAAWDGPLVDDKVVQELLVKHPNAHTISSTRVLSWTLRRLHYWEPDEVPVYAEPDTDAATDHNGPEGPDDPAAPEAGDNEHQHEDGSTCTRTLVDAAFLTFWVRPLERTFPPLIPYHSAVLDLTLPIRNSAQQDNVGGNEAAGAWIEHFDMSVYTTLVLMGQTVSVVSTEAPDRAERRRSARQGIEVRDVRVVKLRREATDSLENGSVIAGDEDEVAVDDASTVGPQWPRTTHRQVWIHSHVKGPEDQPFVTGHTDIVNALTR